MKRDLIYIFLILIFFGTSLYLYLQPEKIITVTEIKENREKIDSLYSIISQDSIILDSLRNQKAKVIKKVIVEIRELKILDPDSTISIFHENTKKYGELGSTKPKLQEDSTIICTADNLRDANIIAAKYEGSVEENRILDSMVTLGLSISEKKDSIIKQESIIIKKNEAAYKESITNLSAVIKKEKKKKTLIIGSSIGVILGLLLLR